MLHRKLLLLTLQVLYIACARSSFIERESPAPGDAEYYNMYASYDDESRLLTKRKGKASNSNSCDHIRRIPADVRAELELDNFYQRYTEAYGIPIVTSSKVSDAAIQRACYTARFLLADHYAIRDGYYKRNGRFVLMDSTENITDIPEFSHLNKWWNVRARGLGGVPGRPVSLGAEENAECAGRARDRWHTQDIVLHEFAHGMHLVGAQYEIENFQNRLSKAFNSAKSTGLWNNTYAMSSINEYFAEAVGSYFDQNYDTFNGKPNGIKNHVDTREELKSYDRPLFNLVKEMFPCNNEYIDRCQDKDQAKSLRQSLRINYPDCTLDSEITTIAATTTTERSTTSGETPCDCKDNNARCASWARYGYCTTNYYVHRNCNKSCELCNC